MTKVRITGRDDSGQQRSIEVSVNAEPADAATHPEVRRLENVLQKRYKVVTIEIIT